MLNQQEYRNLVIGKKIDMDGAYGAQCWDLFAHFCKTTGYPIINCTSTGFVHDIANNKATNGLLTHFVEVSLNQMQDGDWVVWGECSSAPYSHIAMYRKDNGNGYGIFLGQNQGGRSEATEIIMPFAGIIGIFRPNCYVREPKKTIDEIVKEVINGIWGNGNDRKNRLTAAGYDYATVQSHVNQILSNSTLPPTKPSIITGSHVRVKNGALDYNGVRLASFVYNNVYTVQERNNKRAVLKEIQTAVHIDNLYLV